MIRNRTRNADNAMDALTGAAALLGRSRIAFLSSKFYADPPPGPVETASVLAMNSTLAADLIRVANTVQHGAGIPVLNIEAATVRMGADRARALAIAYDVAQVLASTLGHATDIGDHWRRGLVRGCLARALAMNADRRLAGQAFLVGLLQDVGEAVLAAAEPQMYSTLRERSEGCPLRLAMLEWQSFNLNHIHTAHRLLREWQLPMAIIEAVGRHHTNPPLSPAMAPAIRLWQIAYVAGAVPIGPAPSAVAMRPLLLRLLGSAFNIKAGGVSALIDQTAEEYRDVEGLFSRHFTSPVSVMDLLSAASTLALDASSPADSVPETYSIRARNIAAVPVAATIS